jgi:hypothetical protein
MASRFAMQRILGVVAATAVVSAAPVVAAQTRVVSPIAGVHKSLELITRRDLTLPPRGPIMARPARSGGRARIAQGQAYSIVIFGAPKAPNGSSSTPIGFNNTGQIYGSCSVYTGARFLNFPSSAYSSCSATSMSDASSSTGAFSIGGVVGTPYDPNSSGFVATFTAGKGGSMRSFESSRPDSDVYSVDAAGDAYLSSYSILDPDEPQVYLSKTRSFQGFPACSTSGNSMAGACFEPVRYYDECPFGGCEHNENGLFLGAASNNPGFWYLYNPSTNSGISVADFIDEGEFSPSLYAPQLSDYGLVVFETYPSFGSQAPQTALAVYSIASQAWNERIGLADCTGISQPISMNNLGEVLGYAVGCPDGNEYFTWDPENGTQVVQGPPSGRFTSIYPLGVNDNGQILISAQTSSSNGTYWGVLNPDANSTSSLRRTSANSPRPHRL